MSKMLSPENMRSFFISALRDQSQWPQDFKWYFGSCRTCAMGLLDALLKRKRDHLAAWASFTQAEDTAKTLGMPLREAYRIFLPISSKMCIETYGTSEPMAISPEMVAAEIEKFHQQQQETQKNEHGRSGRSGSEGGGSPEGNSTGPRERDSGEDRIHSWTGSNSTWDFVYVSPGGDEPLHTGIEERVYCGWDFGPSEPREFRPRAREEICLRPCAAADVASHGLLPPRPTRSRGYASSSETLKPRIPEFAT